MDLMAFAISIVVCLFVFLGLTANNFMPIFNATFLSIALLMTLTVFFLANRHTSLDGPSYLCAIKVYPCLAPFFCLKRGRDVRVTLRSRAPKGL